MGSLVKVGERGVSSQLSLSQQGCACLLHHIPGGGSVSVISRVVAIQRSRAAHWLLGGIRIFLWPSRQSIWNDARSNHLRVSPEVNHRELLNHRELSLRFGF